MEDILACTNCGNNEFIPVIRMEQGGNHSLSLPSAKWAGAKCSGCGAYHDDVFLTPYLTTKHFK